MQKTTWISIIVLSLFITNLVFYKPRKNRENKEKALKPSRINCTASVFNLPLFKKVPKKAPKTKLGENIVKTQKSTDIVVETALTSTLQWQFINI